MLMELVSLLVGGCVILLATVQVAVGSFYALMLCRQIRVSPEPAYTPRAAVILAVRGLDPFLERTIRGLSRQEYSDYSVFIVVDSDEDIAIDDIRHVLNDLRPDNFVVTTLTDHKLTCSLKCSALIQAVEQLDDTYEVIAFIDADAPPHPGWLRDLVSPLQDVSVGVVTGNRWFVPSDARWGSLVRYLWNAAAIVQVWINQIVWAGSMAMRAETAHDPELLSAWGQALSVDATVTRHVKSHGLKVHFEPTVIMINEEGIGLARFQRWVERQLVAARSSGSVGFFVSLHTFSVTALQVAAVCLLGRSMLLDKTGLTLLLSISIAAYWTSAVLSLAVLEIAVGKIARRNSIIRTPLNWKIIARILPATVLTHFVYAFAFWSSRSRSKISWRGIEYEIHEENQVRMTNYHPFAESSNSFVSESVT